MNYIEYEMDYERTNKVEVFMTEMAEAIAEFKKFSEVEKSKEITDYFARVKKVFDKFAKNDDIKIYEVLGFVFDEFLESLEHNNIKTKEVSFGIESISGIKKVYESVPFEDSLDYTLEKFMNSLDSFQKHYLLCLILNPELHKVYLCSKKFKFWGDEFCEKFGCIKKVYKKLVDLSLESDIYQKYA